MDDGESTRNSGLTESAISIGEVYRHFFLQDETITGHACLDNFQNTLISQLQDQLGNLIWQHDDALSHFLQLS